MSNQQNENKTKNGWSTAKLVIGIISLVLFILIALQSCAAGLGNALSNNNSTSGSQGFMCALFMLIGGIIAIATRNSTKKGGSIAAIIMYFLGAILTLGSGSTYGDLPIWGAISFDFGLVCLASILSTNKTFSQEKNKKFLIIGLIVLSIISLIIGVSSGSKETKSDKNKSAKTSETNKNKTYTLGDSFTFDNLEIKLGAAVSFDTINNEFADENGQTVVKVPVSITNKSSETHSLNMFYYKFYGSKGTEVKNESSYFDDSIDEAGDMQPNATMDGKYFIMLYDGNGKYSIEFNNYSEKIKVSFDVQK